MKAIISLMTSLILFADDSKTITVEYNLPSASIDDNKSNWTNENWTSAFTENNIDGIIGNTMMNISSSSFLNHETTDTSDLTVDSINENGSSSAAQGYSENFRRSLTSTITSNGTYKPKTNTHGNTLECYITRDLPFRYRCEESGITYGADTILETTGGGISNVDGLSGKEALGLCKENCKKEVSCIQVFQGNEEVYNPSDETFSFKSIDDYTSTYNLSSDKEVKYFLLNIETSIKDKNNKTIDNHKTMLDITFLDINDKEVKSIANYWTRFIKEEKKISINGYIKKIRIRVHSQDKDSIVTGNIKNSKIIYKTNSKYMCPPLQDVANKSNGGYAYQCPSGHKTSFGDYQICSGGSLKGDNLDATFSNLNQCNNQCNIPKNCVAEFGTFDATIFQTFREGKLGKLGSNGKYTNSSENDLKSDADCTLARKSNYQVINETTYDANTRPTQTVFNGSLVKGIDIQRPRILSSVSSSFENRKKEEWKDGAYETMLKEATYSKSNGNLSDERPSQFAYYMSTDSGVAYGVINSLSKRRLIWRLKPSSYCYGDDVRYKLYAVVRIDTERYKKTINGNEIVRDQVYYIKTSLSDTFIPFARAYNYATSSSINIGLGEIVPAIKKISSVSPKGTTFKNNMWMDFSLNQTVPSFDNTIFSENEFWHEYSVLSDSGNIINILPGLVKSSTTDYLEKRSDTYTGDYDGTGEGIAGYEVFTFYSKDNLSYSDLMNKIKNIDDSGKHQVENTSAKIYKAHEEKYFSKYISGDNIQTQSGIDIYQYGKINKSSLKVKIKPQKKDVGKNAFIFIFMY